MTRNDYGVKTLLDESIHDELHCILGLLPGCPVPDVLILNSGLHDRNLDQREFVSVLSQAVNMIKKLVLYLPFLIIFVIPAIELGLLVLGSCTCV